MTTQMRLLLATVLAALALPVAALANDAPSPAAVAACQAEAVQLGKDAFVGKYGPTEPFGHCYAAHAGDAPAPQPQPLPPVQDDPVAAACKAEYLQLGADAFKAKYGETEPYAACLKGQTKPKQPEKPKQGDDGAASVASALCTAAAKTLGRDAFVARFGPKEAMGTCMKKALARAKALVASCKASSGSSKDAFKACIAAGVGAPAPKRR